MILPHQIPAFVRKYNIEWRRNQAGFDAYIHFVMPNGDPDITAGRGRTEKLAYFAALEKAAKLLDDAEKAAGIQP